MNDPNSNVSNVPATAHERATWVRWRILAILLAYSFMSWFNRNSIGVAGNEAIIEEYDITETQMGWVITAFFIPYAVCMTPGGWFADRYGAWIALLLMGFGSAFFGALTGAVGLALAAGTTAWIVLMVVRFLMGTFTAPIYPASGRAVMHWMPFEQRGLANGLIMGAALVGIASVYYGFGLLMDAVRWPTAFLITGGITALFALVWYAYAKDYPFSHPGVNKAELAWIGGHANAVPGGDAHDGQQDRRSTCTKLLTNRSLILLTISYAAIGYVEYLFYFWLERYFDKILELGKDRSRLYTTIVMAGMAAGMMAGGQLSDRLVRAFGYRAGRAIVPAGGMFLGAILLTLGVFVTDLTLIVICFTLALAAVGACEGPCWATAIDMGGAYGGTSAGIFNTGGNVGGKIAPVVTPWVAVSLGLGWPAAICIGSIICIAGGCLWLWIDPRERVAEP